MKREGCPPGFKEQRGKCVLVVPDQWKAFRSKRVLRQDGFSCGVQERNKKVLVVCDKLERAEKLAEKYKDVSPDKLLEKMYKHIGQKGHSFGRDGFRALVDLLADQEGLTHTKYPELKKELDEMLFAYRTLARQKPKDYLGELVGTQELGNKSLCQNFTPTAVTDLMAQMTLGTPEDMMRVVRGNGGRPIRLLEPAMGTGAMVIAANNHVPENIPMEMHGIELDPLMYKAALVNMAIMARHPYKFICANTLALDPNDSRPWVHANKWDPPSMYPYYMGGE
jgi:type I restriction-modification system DNA methylase subunit